MNTVLNDEKWHFLQKARSIVIKVGSAVLTGPHGLDIPILQNLVAQIAFIRSLPSSPQSTQAQAPKGQQQPTQRKIILVSSGAVAAGRAALQKLSHISPQEIQGLAAKQAAAAVGQSHLMQQYNIAFANHNLGTAQVLLTRDDLRSRQRFLNARNTFAELLSWNIVPVVNENDTISVQELKFGDNDCLSSLLINLVGADLFINLTSAQGVLDKNPEKYADAAIMPCIDNIHTLDLTDLCGAKTSVGTGGMYSKLLAARRAAQLGVPTLILPGKEHDILRHVFTQNGPTLHGTTGTWVCADSHAISRRKFWLAYQSEPSGTIIIDAGAVNALENKGSSLLPGGICSVEGNFQQGALVRIMTQEKNSVAVGLSNYSAAEIKRIMGLKRHEVAAILGNAHYPEVIHRDNLLLDAAV